MQTIKIANFSINFGNIKNHNKKARRQALLFLFYTLSNLQILLLTIIKIKSKSQMMLKPKKILITPATIFPSWKRVIIPQTQEVTGMIAKITLTM